MGKQTLELSTIGLKKQEESSSTEGKTRLDRDHQLSAKIRNRKAEEIRVPQKKKISRDKMDPEVLRAHIFEKFREQETHRPDNLAALLGQPVAAVRECMREICDPAERGEFKLKPQYQTE